MLSSDVNGHVAHKICESLVSDPDPLSTLQVGMGTRLVRVMSLSLASQNVEVFTYKNRFIILSNTLLTVMADVVLGRAISDSNLATSI